MYKSTSYKPSIFTRTFSKTIVYDTGDVPYVMTVPSENQYLDALNKGKFVPGIFRCNANTISKQKVLSAPFGFCLVGPMSGWPYNYFEASGELGYLGSPIQSGVSSITGHTTSVDTKARDLAIIQAYARLNSPDTFDGGVFLAELAETIAMLRSPLRSLVKLLSSRKFRDPRKLAKAGADTWMEFRYGVRPLIGDISGVAKLFRKKEVKTERVLFCKRARVDRDVVTVRDISTTVGSIAIIWHERGEAKVGYNAGVSYHKNLNVPNRAYNLGLTVESLPSVLWEMVPLSFVADWFYSTGDWLRAIQPNPTVTKLGGHISVKTDQTIHRNAISCSMSGIAGYVSATADLSCERLDRYCNTSLPALPVVKIPSITLSKVIDSCILITQRIPTAWKQAIASIGRRR